MVTHANVSIFESNLVDASNNFRHNYAVCNTMRYSVIAVSFPLSKYFHSCFDTNTGFFLSIFSHFVCLEEGNVSLLRRDAWITSQVTIILFIVPQTRKSHEIGSVRFFDLTQPVSHSTRYLAPYFL